MTDQPFVPAVVYRDPRAALAWLEKAFGFETTMVIEPADGDVKGAHYEIAEPEDQFYGDRTYRAVDPEGHVWTFGMRVRSVTREEAERAAGLKIQGWI